MRECKNCDCFVIDNRRGYIRSVWKVPLTKCPSCGATLIQAGKPMNGIEELRQWLIKFSITCGYRGASRIIGIDHTTIYKICNGTITDPKLSTVLKIQNMMEHIQFTEDGNDKRIAE